jgi:histone H3/H4
MAKKTKKTKSKAKTTKAKAKSRGTKKKSQREMLLVSSKVKGALREHGVNVSSEVTDALNDVVYWYIDQAAKRAEANKRKTVRAYDFMA